MKRTRGKFTVKFKTQVVLEAVRNIKDSVKLSKLAHQIFIVKSTEAPTFNFTKILNRSD